MPRPETPCPLAEPIYGNLNESQQLYCWRSQGIRDYLLMYTVDGCCRLNYAQSHIDLTVGSWVLIEPQHRHDYYLPGDHHQGYWQVLWCVFQTKASWFNLLDWNNLAPGYGHFQATSGEQQKNAYAHLLQAIEYARADWPGAANIALNQLEASLLWLQLINPHQQQQGWDERIRQACDHWSRDHQRPFHLDDMAAEQDLSIPQFSRLFKKHTGMSAQQYVEQQRLEHACQLLSHTGLSINEIATRCGYDDAFYFSTRFRKRFNCSPRGYRQGQ